MAEFVTLVGQGFVLKVPIYDAPRIRKAAKRLGKTVAVKVAA